MLRYSYIGDWVYVVESVAVRRRMKGPLKGWWGWQAADISIIGLLSSYYKDILGFFQNVKHVQISQAGASGRTASQMNGKTYLIVQKRK
jgi:hypothetical protein